VLTNITQHNACILRPRRVTSSRSLFRKRSVCLRFAIANTYRRDAREKKHRSRISQTNVSTGVGRNDIVVAYTWKSRTVFVCAYDGQTRGREKGRISPPAIKIKKNIIIIRRNVNEIGFRFCLKRFVFYTFRMVQTQ